MTVHEAIAAKLAATFEPAHLDITNESGNHNVPPGSESHFKVVIVAAGFEGKRLIERHRLVHAALSDLLAGPIHALALHTYTEADWSARFGAHPMSPPCRGGG